MRSDDSLHEMEESLRSLEPDSLGEIAHQKLTVT